MLWPSLVATFLILVIPFEENCLRLQLNPYRTLAGSMGEHRLAKDQAAAGECIGCHGGERLFPSHLPCPYGNSGPDGDDHSFQVSLEI